MAVPVSVAVIRSTKSQTIGINKRYIGGRKSQGLIRTVYEEFEDTKQVIRNRK
jgi:hypothetical protein